MIGIFDTYQIAGDQTTYHPQCIPNFIQFMKEEDSSLEFKVFNPIKGEFPASIDDCQAWIIPGSPKSAYEKDSWIEILQDFVRSCDENKKTLMGGCFGHQLIALALGGSVGKADRGWGIGAHEFKVKKQKNWMSGKIKRCKLLFSHQDQVFTLPKDAEVLAESDFCPIQMYSIGEHIFCFQGHPEYSPEFLKIILDSRVKLFEKKTYEKAISSLNSKVDADLVRKWMCNFLRS